jgi:hypothetical protein
MNVSSFFISDDVSAAQLQDMEKTLKVDITTATLDECKDKLNQMHDEIVERTQRIFMKKV